MCVQVTTLPADTDIAMVSVYLATPGSHARVAVRAQAFHLIDLIDVRTIQYKIQYSMYVMQI